MKFDSARSTIQFVCATIFRISTTEILGVIDMNKVGLVDGIFWFPLDHDLIFPGNTYVY